MRLYKPVTDHTDTFRELVDLWGEAGFVEVVPTQTRHCWLRAEEDILLMDWDRHDFLPQRWNIALFGNPTADRPRSYPWTYFARRPRLLEAQRQKGFLSFHERTTESIFLGRIENPEQGANRISAGTNWGEYIQEFACPVVIGGELKYLFTQEQYLERMSRAKFGLSLPGFGKKCCRDIELLGLGVVPIMTPGLDTEHYFEPLKEGVHYLRVSKAEEIPALICSVSEKQWEMLSNNGRSWYERNCSPAGSWALTMQILRSIGAFSDSHGIHRNQWSATQHA